MMLKAAKTVAARRATKNAPSKVCSCGDNDGLWCSLPGCPHPKQPSIFLPSDPSPSQHVTGDQHPDDIAVDRFAAAMKAKLAKKRDEGRGGWDDPEQCSLSYLGKLLMEHIEKGDPVDICNFAMMIHERAIKEATHG